MYTNIINRSSRLAIQGGDLYYIQVRQASDTDWGVQVQQVEWLQGCEGQMGVRQNRLQSHHDHSARRDCKVLPRTHSLNTVYVLSRQGNPVLQIGKYRYRKWTGNKELKARWICNRNNNGCPAKVVTLHGVVVNLQGEHNH